MKKSRHQILPFATVLLMVLSIFAFSPASGAGSISSTISGFLDNGDQHYSFASFNGTAEYDLNITNNGDASFDSVVVSASFDDDTWMAENVTFTNVFGGDSSNISIELGSLDKDVTRDVLIAVHVGEGVNVPSGDNAVELTVNIEADGSLQEHRVSVVVTNWVAHAAAHTVHNYDRGDAHDYQIHVQNIAVDAAGDNVAISDKITVEYSASSAGTEWYVTSTDDHDGDGQPDWTPSGGILYGMDSGNTTTWNITVNLTGPARAGAHNLDFMARSEVPGGPFGGVTYYYQPPGLTTISVSANSWYGVGTEGGTTASVNLESVTFWSSFTWPISIKNLGNTEDTYAISWSDSELISKEASGWSHSVLPTTTGLTPLPSGQSYEEDISVVVPVGALAGDNVTFTMTATSQGDSSITSTQTFKLSVEQYYGISLSVDSNEVKGLPGNNLEFRFNLTNDGNGEDIYSVVVDGAGGWTPTVSEPNVTVAAGSTEPFFVYATVPSNAVAGESSGNITVTVTSSCPQDPGKNATAIVTGEASQVHDVSVSLLSGSNGTASIEQGLLGGKSLQLEIVNNGNGNDLLSLELSNSPAWATLEYTSVSLLRGQNQTITIKLAPLSGDLPMDYNFQMVATSINGDKWTSPSLTVTVTKKVTEGEEIETVEIEETDDGGLPGFSALLSLLTITFVVLLRRRN